MRSATMFFKTFNILNMSTISAFERSGGLKYYQILNSLNFISYQDYLCQKINLLYYRLASLLFFFFFGRNRNGFFVQENSPNLYPIWYLVNFNFTQTLPWCIKTDLLAKTLEIFSCRFGLSLYLYRLNNLNFL